MTLPNQPDVDEILVPLFVQARQEALKEANKIPLNRSGIVTSTPTKVVHLTQEAKQALYARLASEAEDVEEWVGTHQGNGHAVGFKAVPLSVIKEMFGIKE